MLGITYADMPTPQQDLRHTYHSLAGYATIPFTSASHRHAAEPMLFRFGTF